MEELSGLERSHRGLRLRFHKLKFVQSMGSLEHKWSVMLNIMVSQSARQLVN